ncbi:MAG TPA: hypothetical protein VNN22_01340 [Verrucomicrobiae bacterium]|nr:hypothetical protein [Verrucomicrobiae bacterium]
MKFRLLPPAAGELRSAARYYEAQVPGLGRDFLHEVRATIVRIRPMAGSLAAARCGNPPLPHSSFSLRHQLRAGK